MDSRRQFARVGALGAAVGAAAWLSFAHLTARPAVETAPPLRASADLADKSANITALTRAPLFAPPSGLVAQAPAPSADIHLLGIARSPGRRAALLVVGGSPAAWVAEGQSIGGFTLNEVGTGRASLQSALGQSLELQVFPEADGEQGDGR